MSEKNPPRLDLYTEEKAREQIDAYIKSHEWWVYPHISPDAIDWTAQIEERYYMGEANADFEIVIHSAPGAIGATSFARKTRMSARQLAEILHEIGATDDVDAQAQALETQDVLILVPVTSR